MTNPRLMSANLCGSFSDSSLPDSDLKTEEISPSSFGAASVAAARRCKNGTEARTESDPTLETVDVVVRNMAIIPEEADNLRRLTNFRTDVSSTKSLVSGHHIFNTAVFLYITVNMTRGLAVPLTVWPLSWVADYLLREVRHRSFSEKGSKR